MNNDNNDEKKIEIVDSNLLNPFKSTLNDIDNENSNKEKIEDSLNSNSTDTIIKKSNFVESNDFNSKSMENLNIEQKNEEVFNNHDRITESTPIFNSEENRITSINSGNNIKNTSNTTVENEQYNQSRLNSLSKTLKNDMLTFAVLQFLIVTLQIILDVNYVSDTTSGVYFGIYILCYFGAKNQKSYAGKVGIIVSVLMILSIINRDILDCVLGIILLSHSIKYTKAIKINGKNEKDLKYILAGVGAIILVTGINVFIRLQDSKLQCTRKNGDKIVVKFDSAGISSYNVNGNDTEPILYETQFLQKFLYAKQTEKDYLTAFKNIVKEHEQNNGATCK